MIIKRISQGLLSQNWKELFVELLVVIVGVFIAMQVENWNELRKELTQEKALLQSLSADMQENEEIGAQRIERFSDAEAAALKLLQIAQSNTKPVNGEFYSLLNAALNQRPPIFISNTWDLLTASGQLTIVRNPAIKEQLSGFYRTASAYSEALGQRAAEQREAVEQFLAVYLDMQRFVYAMHSEDLSFLEFDNEELVVLDSSAREDLKNLSIRIWHTARDFRLNLGNTLELRDAIEDSLLAELERFN